jgi:hypothetical protein
MEQQDGFAPSTPWNHRGDLVWVPRKQDAATGRAPTCARDAGGASRAKMARPSVTSEAIVVVVLPRGVELQIEEAG